MSELKIVQTSEQKGKGQMIFEIMNAKRNVTAYLAKHLSDYKLVKIIRKSIYPEDAHLYMVSAKRKDGKFAVWTSWNENTQSLNHGHYNLDSLETCNKIFEEYKNIGSCPDTQKGE